MNINMTRFRWFSKMFVFLVLRTKIALALEGFNTFQTALIRNVYNQNRLGIVKIINSYPANHNNCCGVQQCSYVSQQDKG